MTQSLGDDTTLFVEHLQSPEEYAAAIAYIRAAAEKARVHVK